MSARSREALLREISAHPRPDDPVWDSDLPDPALILGPEIGLSAEHALRFRRDFLMLACFAAEVCGVQVKALCPADLMRQLAGGGRSS